VDLPPESEVESDEREDAKRGYQRRGIDEHHHAGAEQSAGPLDPFAEGGIGTHGQAEDDDSRGHDQQTGQRQRVEAELLEAGVAPGWMLSVIARAILPLIV
jgi:hypothetical protein